jgi:hypothetical protein
MAEQEDDLEMNAADVEAALRRQDEALALLERLRLAEPMTMAAAGVGGGRREGRRWPPPQGVTLELHDTVRWQNVDCLDLGVGGARIQQLPDWANGPTPARLRAGRLGAILALADVMWHDTHAGVSGIRFEFLDSEDREAWAGMLIDSLLARYAL